MAMSAERFMHDEYRGWIEIDGLSDLSEALEVLGWLADNCSMGAVLSGDDDGPYEVVVSTPAADKATAAALMVDAVVRGVEGVSARDTRVRVKSVVPVSALEMREQREHEFHGVRPHVTSSRRPLKK